MSDENRIAGGMLYRRGQPETRAWFESQWKAWPRRVDDRFTTNMSFHHGGVVAFRAEHGRDPEMSDQLRSNVEWLDQNQDTPA